MTDEQAEALRVFQRQVGTFYTPPGCDDGVLARSFAYNDEFIYEFALRNADHFVTLSAYRHPGRLDENSWAAAIAESVPNLGTRIGELYSGPLNKMPLPGPDSKEA